METGAWSSSLPQPLADLGTSWYLPSGFDKYQAAGLIFCAAAAITVLSRFNSKDSDKWAVINPASAFDLFGKARRDDYQRNSMSYVAQGVKQFGEKPFKVLATHGDLTILPGKWADHIRNDPNVHFMKSIHEDFHADLEAFGSFAASTSDDALLQSVARKQLTKYLNKVTVPLSLETTFSLNVNYGNLPEWKEFPLYPTMLDVVARISSIVFLGDELCRDERWLEITKNYTVSAFRCAEELRVYPKWYRPIASLYHPGYQRLLQAIVDSRDFVGGVIKRRRELAARGEYTPSSTDAIDWFEEEAAGRPYDPALCQIALSTAAIHTTSELANGTLLILAQRPELVEEIRTEVVQVLRQDGLKKISLYNMKLLDSVMKETQRINRPALRLNRKVLKDTILPDGSVLRKGERFAVSTSLMGSPEVYENPDEFDPYRFLRYRDQEDKKSHAHLVSTGPAHLGFGHGKHGCPGRFFAANELKVLMCHMLLKYDLKLPEGYVPKLRFSGSSASSDPKSRILLKSREPELDLDALEG